MNKAMLVVDMPDNCSKCDLYVCYRQYAGDRGDCFCGKTKQNTPLEGVPSWCPLKPAPNKLGIRNRLPMYDTDMHYEQGWNACVDDILEQ